MEAITIQPPAFQGFASPNYTMVPDEVFDQLLSELSGAELKVLLYIIRRTFGFKRESDNISLSQMLGGLKSSDGRILDRGVGITKKTLLGALDSLEARNVIIRSRRQSAQRGNEPTAYRLNVLAQTYRQHSSANVTTRPAGSSGTDAELAGYQASSRKMVPAGPGVISTLPQEEKIHQGPGAKSTPPPGVVNTPHNKESRETEHDKHEQQHIPASSRCETADNVVVALVKLGVTKKIAHELTVRYSKELIHAQIDMLAYRPADDPPAVLVKAIREDWAPPAGYQTPEEREVAARGAERIQAELGAWREDELVSKATGDEGKVHHVREAVEFRPFGGVALDSRRAWATALMSLKGQQGAEAYLGGTRLLARDGNELVVGTRTSYAAEWLQRRMGHQAAQVLSAIGGEPVAVRFVAEADWLSRW